MIFKVNQANLNHLVDVLENYPKAWLHGDGNVYVDQDASDFRKDYGNPHHNNSPAAGAYRIMFDDVDDIPTGDNAIEQIEKMLMESARQEMKKAERSKEKTEVKVLPQKQKFAAPKVDPNAEKEAQLKETAEFLQDKEDQLHAAANNVAGQRKELAEKEAQLADKEAQLKALEARLAAIQPEKEEPKTTTNPATGPKPVANK